MLHKKSRLNVVKHVVFNDFFCLCSIDHTTRMSTICGELVCDSRKTRKWQCGTKT